MTWASCEGSRRIHFLTGKKICKPKSLPLAKYVEIECVAVRRTLDRGPVSQRSALNQVDRKQGQTDRISVIG